MLVYGDRFQTVDPRRSLAEISDTLETAAKAQSAGARHDLLTRALIESGQLAQGLADAEFDNLGWDQDSPAQTAAMGLAVGVARRFSASPCEAADPRFSVAAQLTGLAALPLPALVNCKTPEGYAFYAVYPEAYAAAVEAEHWEMPPLVIGLRSIGTSLAAVAAAAAEAQAIVTLRPCGHPFERQVRVGDELRARLADHGSAFLIVDEGPGLSGSSFGAVADLLGSLGVASDRMIFLASHRGEPGPQACDRHRRIWRETRRLVITFDDLMEQAPLHSRFADLVGEVNGVEDLSGGAWRSTLPPAEQPPAWTGQERRKFRLTTTSGVYLAKFAGLGMAGKGKLARAQALHLGGFAPEPIALRSGFLLERWVKGEPLRSVGSGRSAFLAHLARYLAFRAQRFPAAPSDGANAMDLRAMVLANADELAGANLGRRLEAALRGFDNPGPASAPVQVDGRLQHWEWLRTPDGGFMKTDALDHACGHDLIGCQAIGWDVAGAAVEFQLLPTEIRQLRNRIAAAGAAVVGVATIEMFRICYVAFQAAYWSMAEQAAPTSERHVILRRRDRLLRELRRLADS
ncbi:MAG: hypothetical protein M3Y22_05445 [Pseudomonadota bacterium]|nr:hypothetical protein [Pseudomonadota bacterium]